MKEKVIFRKYYNSFTEEEEYLAVFPDDPATRGCYVAVPFSFSRDGRPWFEALIEVSWDVYYKKTKIVHKNDPVIQDLLDAMEVYYGCEFKVMEKIVR